MSPPVSYSLAWRFWSSTLRAYCLSVSTALQISHWFTEHHCLLNQRDLQLVCTSSPLLDHSNHAFIFMTLLGQTVIAQSCSTLCDPTDYIAPARILCPWNFLEYWSRLAFPTRGVFLAQELKPYLLHWQADSLPLSHSTGHCLLKNRYTGSSASRTLCSSLSLVTSLP